MTTTEIEALAATRPDVAEAWGRYRVEELRVKASWAETFFTTAKADGRDTETWRALNDGLEAAMAALEGELKSMGVL